MTNNVTGQDSARFQLTREFEYLARLKGCSATLSMRKVRVKSATICRHHENAVEAYVLSSLFIMIMPDFLVQSPILLKVTPLSTNWQVYIIHIVEQLTMAKWLGLYFCICPKQRLLVKMEYIESGVPLLFIFINDNVINTHLQIKIFAGDTSLFI